MKRFIRFLARHWNKLPDWGRMGGDMNNKILELPKQTRGG